MNATRVSQTDLVVYALTALTAMAFGAFAALGSGEWLVFVSALALIGVLAFALSESFMAPTLIAFAVLQFYLTIPGTSATIRGAFVFVVCVALRAVLTKKLVWQKWMIPASGFMLAALVAALDAPNRYVALKGVYDWSIVFLTIFAASMFASSPRTHMALIAFGVLEAVLGLAQAWLGVDRVLDALRLPVSELFLQPNLLRERIAGLSFNWIVFDRALPFGNFINAIDYAVFLAAIASFALAMLLTARTRREIVVLAASMGVMGVALLLTFKGSGMIALLGGASVVAFKFLPRVSRRNAILGIGVVFVVGLCALPFAGAFIERITFLMARELGAVSTTGRVAIWRDLVGVWTQHPWFGVGLNNAEAFVQPTPSLYGGAFTLVVPSAESAYVATLIETGIAGFVALIALFSLALARASNLGMRTATIALLVGNLTVAGFTTDQNGMILGWLIGTGMILQTSVASE